MWKLWSYYKKIIIFKKLIFKYNRYMELVQKYKDYLKYMN